MAGELVYFWIGVPDAQRAQKFYGDLFGWTFSAGTAPDGFQIENTDPPGGLHGGDDSSTPQVCFGVDDLDAAMAKVRELGGESEEPHSTSNGAYAMCRDDQGTSFCLWAPAKES